MAWHAPGGQAPSNNWRYDLAKGWLKPGERSDPRGIQHSFGENFDPDHRNVGWHVLSSPPGAQAPVDSINYTPDTREVHDFGMAAPKDKLNLSVIPDSPGPAQLGTGQDQSPWQQNQNQLGSLGITSNSPWSTQTVGGGSVGMGQSAFDENDDPDKWIWTGYQTGWVQRSEARRLGISEIDPNIPPDSNQFNPYQQGGQPDIPMSYPENGEQPGWQSTPGAPQPQPAPAAPAAPQSVAADPNDPMVTTSVGTKMRKSEADARGISYEIDTTAQGTTTTPLQGVHAVQDNQDPSQTMYLDGFGNIWVRPTGEKVRPPAKSASGNNEFVITADPNNPRERVYRNKEDGTIWGGDATPIRPPPSASSDPSIVYRDVPGKGLTAFDPKTNQQIRPGTGRPGDVGAPAPGGSPTQTAPGQTRALPTSIDTSSSDAFVASLRPLAQAAEARTGVPADAIIAIAANESGWGKFMAGGDTGSNNIFGMKQTENTWQRFATPQAAVDAFANLISTNPRYAQALSAARQGDKSGFIQQLANAGYIQADEAAAWVRQVGTIASQVSGMGKNGYTSGAGADQAAGGSPTGDSGLYVGGPADKTGTWSIHTLPNGNQVYVNNLTRETKPVPGGEAVTKPRNPVVIGNRLMEWDPKQNKYVETLHVEPNLQHFSTNEGIFSFNPESGAVNLVKPKGGFELGPQGATVYPGAAVDFQDYDPKTGKTTTRTVSSPGGPNYAQQGGTPAGGQPQTVPPVQQPPRPSTLPPPPPMDAAGSPVSPQNQAAPQIEDQQQPEQYSAPTELDDPLFNGQRPPGYVDPLEDPQFGGGQASGVGYGQAGDASDANEFFMIPVMNDFAGDVGVGQDESQMQQSQPQTVGADSMQQGQGGGGWQPPIDPSQVVGGGNKFGDQVSMEGTHEGTDLQAYKGTPVVSPVDGTVVDITYDPKGLGLQVVVRASDGVNHTLAHLDQAHVQIGQQVRIGEPLGQVGESGAGATGPHLDYRMQGSNGQSINPEPMLGQLGQLPPAPGTVGEGDPQQSSGASASGMGQGWNPRVGWGQDEGEDTGFEIDPNASGGAWGVNSGNPPGLANYGNSAPGGVNLNATVDNGPVQATPPPSQGNAQSVGGAGSQTGYASSGPPAGNPQVPLTPVQMANAKLAQQRIDQQTKQIDQAAKAEQDRHNEALATAKNQQEVNAENNRHNQEMEQIQRDQNSISQEANRLGLIEKGTFQQQQQASLAQSALKNPWLQNLTGMAPGFGQPGWSSQTGGGTLQSLLSGWTPQGTLGAAGISDSGLNFGDNTGGSSAGFAGNAPLSGLPPMPTYDQWQQMTPFEQAAWRTATEMVQPWQATQSQLQQFWASSPSAAQKATNSAGSTQGSFFGSASPSSQTLGSQLQAPGVTSMPGVTQQQAMNMNPRDLQSTQNTAEIFGQTPDELWKNSQRQWSQAAQPTVSQSFHVPNQGGVGTGQGRGWRPRIGRGQSANDMERWNDSRSGGRGPAPRDVARDDWRLTDSFPPDRRMTPVERPAGRDDWSGYPVNFEADYAPAGWVDPHPDDTRWSDYYSQINNPNARQ